MVKFSCFEPEPGRRTLPSRLFTPTMTYLAIGERMNVPWLTAEKEAKWLQNWCLQTALKVEGFQFGTSRKNLYRMLPDSILSVNLLPPSSECGAWDAVRAKSMAGTFQTWAYVTGTRLILLGRRVTTAFLGPRTPLMYSVSSWGVQYLTLPHPSGSCRLLNDLRTRVEIKILVGQFLKGDDSERRGTEGATPGP